MDEYGSVFPRHCKIKENMAVWSMNRWQYYNVDYIEPLPTSSVSIVNPGSVAANTVPATLTELTVFDVDEHQLLQLRFEPLDDVEVQLWETRSQGKFATRGVQARVSLSTKAHDPYLESSEFNILGRDRSAFIAAVNNGGYNYAQSRVLFWGHKYILVPLRGIQEIVDPTGIIRAWQPDGKGNLTPLYAKHVVAEGRLA